MPTPRAVFRKKSEASAFRIELENKHSAAANGNDEEVEDENSNTYNDNINQDHQLRESPSPPVLKEEIENLNKDLNIELSPLLERVEKDIDDDDIFGFNSILREESKMNEKSSASKTVKRKLFSPVPSSDSSSEFQFEPSKKVLCPEQDPRKVNIDYQSIPKPLDDNRKSSSSAPQLDPREINNYHESIPKAYLYDDTEASSSEDEVNIDEMLSQSDDEDEIWDSDYEAGDEVSFTRIRQNNKKIRHLTRNINVIPLHLKVGNQEFIEGMKSFLKQNTIATGNKSTSGMSKIIRNLFEAEDSLLCFEVENNAHFKLENWRNFNQESFSHLQYPLNWLTKTCSHDGGKVVIV